MNPRNAYPLLVGGATLCLLPVGGAHALEIDASLSHTAEYTTNTGRTETDEVSEWIQTPGINVSLLQEGARVQASAAYRYERRFYQEDLFDDESALTGQSELVWRVLPQRLDFTVRDTRTESTLQSIDPLTEANRQTVSYTEAGPTLRFRPRSNSELQLEYLYADVRAEDTDTDSTRHTATARYLVALSPIRNLTFEASYSDIDFDNSLAPDLKTRTGSVTIDKTEGRLDYAVTGGYTSIDRALGRDTVDGLIGAVTLGWNASPVTRVELDAGRRIDDRSSDLMAGTSGFGEGITADSDLNEVMEETMVALTLSRRFGNNELALILSASRQDYEDAVRDSERRSVAATFARPLNPQTTLRAAIETGREEFTDEGREFDGIRGFVQLDRTVTRRFTISLAALYDERSSRDSLSTGDYDEWMGSLTLTYDLRGPR